MKIEIINDDNDYPIGWRMIPENEQDDNDIAIIRDLSFFGFRETHVIYDGLVLKDQEKGKVIGNIESLSWRQKGERNG